jgi:hypothetical protein
MDGNSCFFNGEGANENIVFLQVPKSHTTRFGPVKQPLEPESVSS